MIDRFEKRMKRQADRQVQEDDEGKVTDRFRKRMKRQADRQVQEEDEKES